MRNQQWSPTINIEKLYVQNCAPTKLANPCSWSLVPTDARKKYVSGAKNDSAPVIDLLSHGYAKLLGKGKAIWLVTWHGRIDILTLP